MASALTSLYITSITPPAEVQQAIDDKSRLGVFDDLNSLIKMKAAMALEKAAESQGEAGAGMGMGMGLMMPAMFADSFRASSAGGAQAEPAQTKMTCSDCQGEIPVDSRFCHHCGHQILVVSQCSECHKSMPPGAKFCPRCGHKSEDTATVKTCPHCQAENLPQATFCNQCGERL